MKKRLRKKLHLEEFKEFGLGIKIKFNDLNKINTDTLMNSFIDFVEENTTYCGGGGDNKEWEMIVEINKKLDTPESLGEKIKNFLDKELTEGYELESKIVDL